MPRRVLPAALLVAVACVVAVAVASQGRDPRAPVERAPRAPGSVARTLAQLGSGPSGSAPLTLTRWRYRSDDEDRGVRAGWASGDWGGTLVHVPHSPNARAFNGPAGRRAQRGSVGWYAKDIRVPLAGLYAINFESVHHRAAVFVDGRRVREHAGAYEPFSARVPLAAGRHTIAVRVNWRDPERQAAEGFRRGWFNYGGLNRPVTLARLGTSELGGLNVRTTVDERGRARVRIAVRVRNRTGARLLTVLGTLHRNGRLVRALDFGRGGVGRDRSRELSTTFTVADPALWSPARPDLYDLRIDVPGEASLRRRIGLREIGWGARGLTLNGERLVLRGVALPPDARGRGDALHAADEARIVAGLRAAGANATRAQMPLSESMLARLDAAGILVWQEIGPWEPGGAWRNTTPARVAVARDRALRTADDQQAHPSILAWTLTNEAAGDGPPAQQAYVAQTARRLRALDASRPVAADLWGRFLPRTGGLFAHVDAIGITDYIGWYEDIDRSHHAQAAATAARLDHMREMFAGKPLVVTEFGAAGSARIAPQRFGGLAFQAALLARRAQALAADPRLSGAIVWNLRDYALRPDFRGGSVLKLRPDLTLTPGLNEKGLYDYDGRPKPALAAVRAAFGGP